MTKPAKAILADIYDAWRAHDLDWLGTYLPADFSHSLNIPMEMSPAGGLRLGKDAVLRRLGEIFDGFDAQYLEPGEIAIDGARAIVTYTRGARIAGRGSGSTRASSTSGTSRTAGPWISPRSTTSRRLRPL
jgi:Domain of unknown function (DUF4440)